MEGVAVAVKVTEVFIQSMTALFVAVTLSVIFPPVTDFEIIFEIPVKSGKPLRLDNRRYHVVTVIGPGS